jgi:hypothetical protein
VLDLVVVTGETEVNDLEFTIGGGLKARGVRRAVGRRGRTDGCEEEVFWLKIAMADVVDGVAIFQGAQHRLDDRCRILLGIVTLCALSLLDDSIEELSSCAELGDKMEILVILEDIHELDDVGMVHCLQDLNLALQSFQATDFRFLDCLYSKILFGLTVLAFPHHSVVSVTQLAVINTVLLTNYQKGNKM